MLLFRQYSSRFICLLFGFSGLPATAQVPVAKQLLQDMTNAVRSINAISYKADFTISRGNEVKDSVYRATSWVQATQAPQDTIFGYFFHLQLNTASGNGDFCYEGREGIDIRHESPDSSKSQTVFIMEPFRLRNGANSLELSDMAQGFVKDLLLQKGKILSGVQAQDVRVFDGNEFWILEWEQSNDVEKFVGRYQAKVKKKTLLLSYLTLRATVKGQTLTKKIVIQDVQINKEALPVSCPVSNWSHYRVVRYTSPKKDM
jgi:hypothetical protein